MADLINHPEHYNDYSTNFNGQETIETWEALGYGFQGCVCNAIKYLDRAGKKPGHPETEDMEKAHWYIERALSNPSDLTSWAQVELLKQCLAALADFDLRKARSKMQAFINLGCGLQ